MSVARLAAERRSRLAVHAGSRNSSRRATASSRVGLTGMPEASRYITPVAARRPCWGAPASGSGRGCARGRLRGRRDRRRRVFPAVRLGGRRPLLPELRSRRGRDLLRLQARRPGGSRGHRCAEAVADECPEMDREEPGRLPTVSSIRKRPGRSSRSAARASHRNYRLPIAARVARHHTTAGMAPGAHFRQLHWYGPKPPSPAH